MSDALWKLKARQLGCGYFSAIFLAGFLALPQAQAAFQHHVLKSFTDDNGLNPISTLAGWNHGDLLGTARAGGTHHGGTVFQMGKDGTDYRTWHHFSVSDQDGYSPSGMMAGRDGVWYGATGAGGSNTWGALFALNQDGSGYRVLHHFALNSLGHGSGPSALVQGSDESLYGSTQFGGDFNFGTVFKLNREGGGYEILHEFGGDSDGREPAGRLIEGSDGMLYGCTRTDVWADAEGGTVFRLNKDGSNYTVLHYFAQGDDESFWPLGIAEGSDGALYGTTYWGGSNSSSAGSVFKLHKDGSGFRFLHEFVGYQPNGAIPAGRLVEGRDGTLYGLARVGGPGNGGTVFSLRKDGGGFNLVHSFMAEGGAGRYPVGELLFDEDGALYGTTQKGGDLDFGTIFVLRPAPLFLTPVVSAAGVLLRWEGLPGTTNQLQRATTLDGSWRTLTCLVVPTNGVAEFTDPSPPKPSAFYRAVAR